MSKIRFIGLDVHADTLAVAIAEANGEVRRYGVIPNQLEAIRRMVKKLGPAEELRACYEAGPTGYVLFWQLTALAVACEVIAPSLAPTKPSDRVKTDRRDAERLARSHRAGELTPIWVPDADHEALRDLVRAREDAKQDQLRARHRLSKFLLRHGRRPDVKMKAWTQKHMEWIQAEGALRASRPGSHTAGLCAQGRTRRRAHSAFGEGPGRSHYRRADGVARGGRSLAVGVSGIAPHDLRRTCLCKRGARPQRGASRLACTT
jgi:transposase